MLQVIKAEEVRDGEPRWWLADDCRRLDYMKPEHLHLHPRSCEETTHAIVDRPAPTPAVAPGLDLDAVERAERAMTPGPWSMRRESHFVQIRAADLEELATTEQARGVDVANAAGIVALRNAAPALIAEVRALRAAAEEREADMHMRIRAGYDKAVADAWRAEVAKRDAEIADLRALVESQRRDYLDVCDAIAPETSGPADAAAKVRALRRHYDAAGPDHNLLALLDLYHEREQAALAKLAEAKRLGLEACDFFGRIGAEDSYSTHTAVRIAAALGAL